MLNATLIALVIVLYTFQSFLCKKFSDAYPGRPENASPVFTVTSGLTVVIVAFAVSGFSFSASALTLWLGIANALVLAGYNYFIIKCSQMGPYSILMVFNLAGGITIPALASVVAFDDAMPIPKAIAILAVFVSVYLVSYRKEDGGARKKGFLLACFALALCNGAYGLIFDVQKRLVGEAEKEELVALTYGIAAAVCFITLVATEKRRVLSVFRQTRASSFFVISCSLVVATAINLLVYVLQFVDVTLLYTFDNAGVLLLSVLASWLLFKERLSRLNLIGCIIMCIALACVSVFSA